MNKKSFFQKYLDPNWQKRRLEIFQRDNFKCQLCDDDSTSLHVHHKLYYPDRNPWDYPDHLLITYCSGCHELIQKKQSEVHRKFIDFLYEIGFTLSDFIPEAGLNWRQEEINVHSKKNEIIKTLQLNFIPESL